MGGLVSPARPTGNGNGGAAAARGGPDVPLRRLASGRSYCLRIKTEQAAIACSPDSR